MMTDEGIRNRGRGTYRIYSVGCLPIIFLILLIDLIGKSVVLGIGSICNVQMPTLAKVVQYMGWMFLLSFGAIFVVALFWMLCESLSKFVEDRFRKGQKDKDEDKRE